MCGRFRLSPCSLATTTRWLFHDEYGRSVISSGHLPSFFGHFVLGPAVYTIFRCPSAPLSADRFLSLLLSLNRLAPLFHALRSSLFFLLRLKRSRGFCISPFVRVISLRCKDERSFFFFFLWLRSRRALYCLMSFLQMDYAAKMEEVHWGRHSIFPAQTAGI